MQLRAIRALAALAMTLSALTPTASNAVRPGATEGTGQAFKPAWTPLGLSDKPVTVVVQLSGDPVAIRQEAAARRLDRREKDQIKAQLRAPQDAMRAQIQGLGGTVLANYQAAYNGIKVRIAANKTQQLAALPGVIAVRPLFPIRPSNVKGIPLIGAPGVWQSLGLHGEGVKIAIIDTGIDYTHANFGGPGTVEAYLAALATDTAPADPRLFGPAAPRVKGGIDLVGDDYDADTTATTYQPIPHPDPNPLDCNKDVGHGSHVAGTAAGSGVTAAGTTYTGPYNAQTVSGNSWIIGPGVAPKADLYAVRVFGCVGSTDVVVDAIEWAVDNDMDVINMSLGSDFGSKDSPDAVATTNAVKAGVVVVISAGNAGPNAYILGSPGTADGAVTVAASDPAQTFPGALFTLSTGGAALPVQNSNGSSFTDGSSYQIAVLRKPDGTVSLGCDPAEYAAHPGGVGGKLVVTQRGTCARVARAVYAQKAGAAAAALIDTSTGYPPVEGPITENPDTGEKYTVTIPFFGVRGLAAGSGTDGARLAAADTGTVIAVNAPLANPNFLGFASFSSAGPRGGDSALKPTVTAPGVSTVSTAVGTGNGAETLSGTSMAAPHVTGVAALTRQAHPTWKASEIATAIANTGDPAQVTGYQVSRGGTGLVQPGKSTVSQVVARGDGARLAVALNFGLEEINRDFTGRQTITLENHGNTWASFRVAQAQAAGSPHRLNLDRTWVSVPPRGSSEVGVTLSVPVATAGASNEGGLSFHEVAGLVQFTPATSADNGGVVLRVPYYLVPRALADVSTDLGKLGGKSLSAVATVTNRHGAIAGDADFYAWGLEDSKDPGRVSNDVRAVGVQSFADPSDAFVVFAVNTFDRWSNASTNEFDIYVDVNGDGVDDYLIVGADKGLIETGSFSGVMSSYVFSLATGKGTIGFPVTAPTDSSTALIPVLASWLCLSGEPCLSAANPRIAYHAVAHDYINGGDDVVPGVAKFNVWSSAISQGGFVGGLAPRAVDNSVVISLNPGEWNLTPAKGLMIVTLDNKSGKDEAQLVPVRPRN